MKIVALILAFALVWYVGKWMYKGMQWVVKKVDNLINRLSQKKPNLKRVK